MIRVLLAVLFLCTFYTVSPLYAAGCDGCKTLGGVDVQAVIDYFKAESHPRLMTKYSDAANTAALLAKKNSGMGKTLWDAAIGDHGKTYRIKHQPQASGMYYNLMGMGATERNLFIEKVTEYVPDSREDGPWDNYLDANDLATFLFAYDACANSISASDKAAFLAKVETYVAVARREAPIPGGTGNITENAMAAVGLAALCFPDHPDAYDWLDHSLKFLYAAFQQMENQACIAEGPSYQVGFSYIAITADLCMTLCEHGFDVVDHNDTFLDDVFVFMVKSMRPDNFSVETEDCYADHLSNNIWPAKYMADTEQRRALQWYLAYTGGTGDLKNFITWDPALSTVQVPQWNPTQFLDASSCAVFRNGFGSTDSWLYLLGDNMPFFFSTGGVGGWIHNKNHGHKDASSITMHAHGEYLLTESARFRGTTAKYHNLIMVDGNEDEPAWGISSQPDYSTLTNTFATGFLDGADLNITYAGTDFTRSVLFAKQLMTPAENEYFVVIDDVEAVDGADHIYDLKFHNKKGDITGSGLKEWTTQTNNSLAEIHFLEPDLASVTRMEEALGTGQYTNMDFVDHRILARKTGRSFQYVTVLYPRTTAMASPTVTEINGTAYRGGKVAIGSAEDIILSRKGTGIETVSGIRTDATQALVRTMSGTPAMYMLKNGTLLERGGNMLISSDVPVTVAALEYTDNVTVGGVIELAQAANITFHSADGAVSSWKYFDAGTYDDFSFVMATGGKVKGQVTDSDLGTGIPNVKVEAVAGSEAPYCYTDADGNYEFLWVRPGNTDIRFSRRGYTMATTAGQTVSAGVTGTVDKVLSITAANPVVTASILTTTTNSADVAIVTDKPCNVQVSYGPSASYGSQSTRTTAFGEQTTVSLSGLTPGQLYHYQVTAWDYGSRQGVTGDQEFFPVGAFSDDFADGSYTGKWETASSYWSEAGGVLSKTSTGNFDSDPKRPGDIIFARDVMYESFTLTAKGKSDRSSDKKDFCIVFNYEDDTHYYYAQFSGTLDPDYSGIFKVDGAAKVKVGSVTGSCLPNTDWVDVKIVRDMAAGAVEVYCTDMGTPVYILYDSDFGLGRIGLASERSQVSFDDISIEPEGTVSGITLPAAVPPDATLELTVPNPVTGAGAVPVTVSWPRTGMAADVTVQVLDMAGAPVEMLYRGLTTGNLPAFNWNHAGQPAGVYYVLLTVDGQRAVTRVVIAK